MILPQKHIKLSESVFGLGGFLLNLLNSPKDIDKLWAEYEKGVKKGNFKKMHTFDNFLLSLDFLFIIGAINISQEGKLKKCD